MEVESKPILIQGEEFIYRPNFRSFIEYEKMSKKAFNQIENLEDATMFLYCGIKTGMKYEKKEFNLSFDDFIDKLDDIDVLDVLGEEQEENTEKKTKKEE